MRGTINAKHHDCIQVWNTGICVIESCQARLMFGFQSFAAKGAHCR
jgi:hypothetical protein